MSNIVVIYENDIAFDNQMYRLQLCKEGSKKFIRVYILKGEFQFQINFYEFVFAYFFGDKI